MTLLQIFVPTTRPNDLADLRSGWSTAVVWAMGPGGEVSSAILSAAIVKKYGTTAASRAMPIWAGLTLGGAFFYGVHKSNVKQQSMGGQDVASQHAGSLIAEMTNSGPSALSPHGSSVLPKGRRTVQARKGSKNFSRRRRRAPWCTLHKKSHWCANTRKTRYQPKK